MKLSILAPGHIAGSIAKAAKGLDGIELYAVASRSLERAEAFANHWGFEKAYGSYEEMLSDPQVELVYVATPHSHHYRYAKLCLEHGKHTLVEKPFTVNATQARELLQMSEEKGLLLAEAIWSRYMPSRKIIGDLIKSGIIGEATSMTANLGFPLEHVERMVKPELAGGALLDLGVYPIQFALMTFDGRVTRVNTSAIMSAEGVDQMNNVTLCFENGRMADLHSSMLSSLDCKGVIYGQEGYIVAECLNNIQMIRVFDSDHKPVSLYPVPEQINGYEYELLSCKKAIEEGQCECPEMPHSEILRVMELLDEIRMNWGMRYPCE